MIVCTEALHASFSKGAYDRQYRLPQLLFGDRRRKPVLVTGDEYNRKGLRLDQFYSRR
jgi:hypothetical protein